MNARFLNDGLLSAGKDDIYEPHTVHENIFMTFGIRFMVYRIYDV